MATFITSKGIGETITIDVVTSTGYWKYNHNSTDSSVFSNGSQTITVANANGEFTLIPCLSDGTVSGDITEIFLNQDCNIITFDGTGLTALTYLDLGSNQLTEFDGTPLTSLTVLYLNDNQLTEFDGTPLTSLTELYLNGNQLTEFDGTPLTSLTVLGLNNNQLTEFDGTGLTSLTELDLGSNQLSSINLTGLNFLQYLYVNDNPSINTTSINNSLLAQLAANELVNDWGYGFFYTTGGRTSAGTTDYDYLIANSWDVQGADLVVVGTGKLRVKGVGQINP